MVPVATVNTILLLIVLPIILFLIEEIALRIKPIDEDKLYFVIMTVALLAFLAFMVVVWKGSLYRGILNGMKKINLILVILISGLYYLLFANILWSEKLELFFSSLWQPCLVFLFPIIPIHYSVAKHYLPTTPSRKIFWSVTIANIASLFVVLPIAFYLVVEISFLVNPVGGNKFNSVLIAIALLPLFYFIAVWIEKVFLIKTFKLSPDRRPIKKICWIANFMPFAFIFFLNFGTLIRMEM